MLSLQIPTKRIKKYSKGIHELPPISLRDLLDFKKKNEPIDISNVEPVSELTKRFGSGSMSRVLYQQRRTKL